MMTPVCPRLLNLNNDFVLLRFWARAPEDLSAIEVIYIIIIIMSSQKSNILSITTGTKVYHNAKSLGLC